MDSCAIFTARSAVSMRANLLRRWCISGCMWRDACGNSRWPSQGSSGLDEERSPNASDANGPAATEGAAGGMSCRNSPWWLLHPVSSSNRERCGTSRGSVSGEVQARYLARLQFQCNNGTLLPTRLLFLPDRRLRSRFVGSLHCDSRIPQSVIHMHTTHRCEHIAYSIVPSCDDVHVNNIACSTKSIIHCLQWCSSHAKQISSSPSIFTPILITSIPSIHHHHYHHHQEQHQHHHDRHPIPRCT